MEGHVITQVELRASSVEMGLYLTRVKERDVDVPGP